MRFPSTVNYAYTEVTGTAEELGRIDPEMVAALFANAMYVYGTAERAAMARLKEGQTALLPASKVEADALDQVEYEKLLKEELGASEVGHKHTFRYGDDDNGHSGSFCECGEEEPDYKPEPAVAAKKKPWQQDKPKGATLNIDFDEF